MAKAGPWTDQGEQLSQGAYLALEMRKSTVLGRPAELVWLDDQSPQMGAQNAQKVIEENKVVGIVGGSTSATALAISAVCRRAKIPFVHNNGAAREVTGSQCSPYTFRLLAPVPVQMRAMAPYILSAGKRWYILNVGYSFGQDIARSFREVLKDAGGTEVGGDKFRSTRPISVRSSSRSARPSRTWCALGWPPMTCRRSSSNGRRWG